VPHPVHRLDFNTSGVLLFGKTAYAAKQLMQQFEQRSVRKAYAAICLGSPTWEQLDMHAAICRCDHTARRCERRLCAKGEEGAQASTRLKVFSRGRQAEIGGEKTVASMLLAAPTHGRTHQVRLHCSAAGLPLLGDELYGVQAPHLLRRHALHALCLDFAHPLMAGAVRVRAPMPEDMLAAAGALGLRPP